MKPERQIIFDPFRLDTLDECLWRGAESIPLTPKAFALLRHLAEHAGRLVTKEELLDAVWPETYVTDAVLKVCIGEIRKALGDDPKSPQFIETAHRRGYRFIAKTRPQTSDRGFQSAIRIPQSAIEESAIRNPQSAINLVGRERELAQLRGWLEKAMRGERQVVFVTGEPGIGKTTVVEALLEQTAGEEEVWAARGQCLEHYGAGEAYLPMLEALGRLCRQPGRERLVALLGRHAPTWLVQMPSLISATDRQELQREVLGATRERMLREMAEAIEALTAETPLVLVLEDLHWSDYSTLDLVSLLARRREPARLMVIGTYRPVEVILSGHPLKRLKQELEMHRQCREIALDFLMVGQVREYLTGRFGPGQWVELARVIYERTDGNPLFMVNVVDYLEGQRLIVERDGRWEPAVEVGEIEVGVPESIRQMIEKQIDRLSPEEQRVLEAASVAGLEFPAVAVAAGLAQDIMQVEEWCDGMARRQQFLKPTGIGEFADGTVSARYGFIHSLYQSVLHQQIAPARRVQLHQRIGERGETAYGSRVGEIAAELAMHFEQGRDYRRAVSYLMQAADTDARRYANRGAGEHLTRALELVRWLPEAERPTMRMALLRQRGMVRRSMGDVRGAAEDFETLAAGAREQGHTDQEVQALLYLGSVLFWISRERCLAVIDEAVKRSRHLQDDLLRAHTRGYGAHWNLNLRGWRDEDAQAFVEALQTVRHANDRALLSLHVARDCYHQCLLSNYEAAWRAAEEGMQLALEVGDPFDDLLCKFFGAWALLHSGRWREMRAVLHSGIEMAEKNGHHLWAMMFRMEIAWLHAEAFDFERARAMCGPLVEQAQAVQHETGQLLFKSLMVLGRAHLGLEQHDRALDCFTEITRQVERQEMVMDWILYMPFHLAQGQYWLAQRDYDRARQEAERLCELAAGPGERTYLALGYQILAEAAMAEQNWDQAEAAVSKALAVVEGGDAPLAEWRIAATAARLYEHLGREAAPFWARSAAVLNRLADSLSDAPDVRQSLLAHPLVQSILSPG